MRWATQHIARLKVGEAVQFRPRGKIDSGQLCTVEPVDPAALKVGDGRDWVAAGCIYGRCGRVE